MPRSTLYPSRRLLKLTQEQNQRLRFAAQEIGITVTELIRQYIEEGLNHDRVPQAPGLADPNQIELFRASLEEGETCTP